MQETAELVVAGNTALAVAHYINSREVHVHAVSG